MSSNHAVKDDHAVPFDIPSMPSTTSWTWLFLVALAVRATTLLSQTFFQPDEFFQALEPAHHLVFGHGELTWEWRDLPGLDEAQSGGPSTWKRTLLSWSGRRLRGWLWPGLFAAVYRVLKALKLDDTKWLVLAPRLMLVLMAASTDILTARLSARLFPSPLAPRISLLLSLTSLFNYHALPRALSTSFETFLTTLALVWWPLPKTQGRERLGAALVCAWTGVIVRPTSAVFWLPLGGMLVIRRIRMGGLRAAVRVLSIAIATGLLVLAASTALDYSINRTWSVPILAFLAQNVVLGVSTFYGTSAWHYHFTQSLPILLTTAMPFVLAGIWSVIRRRGQGRASDEHSAESGAAQAALQELLVATAMAIGAFSVISHKEWRFLHFVLPVLLQFGVKRLLERAPITSDDRGARADDRSFAILSLGVSRRIAAYLILVPLGPAIYLSHFHGRAQVGVTEQLRVHAGRQHERPRQSVALLMPCHSIPGMSHIHRPDLANGSLWSLGCEPPIGISDRASYTTEAQAFYKNATSSLQSVLAGQRHSPNGIARPIPDQIVCFGDLLQEQRVAYLARDYNQTWYGWNGFDVLQDEAERRGGVLLWTRRDLL